MAPTISTQSTPGSNCFCVPTNSCMLTGGNSTDYYGEDKIDLRIINVIKVKISRKKIQS
jgi:hypothetical protein